MREPGRFPAELADRLAHFEREGYVTFPLARSTAAVESLPAEVEALWREPPDDLAQAAGGPPRRWSEADPRTDRGPGSRVHDVHSHSAAARDLYLEPEIFQLVEAIFGEEAVAIQSLYFEHGSEQLLHRDEVVVPVAEPGHLVAAWIALEDLHPDGGLLTYVPRSHRMPCFETEPGDYRFDGRRMGPELVERGLAWEAEREREAGLAPQLFAARRGEVLVWHGALRHGGSPVRDPRRTRRSFVVHFSTARTYRERSISIVDRDGGWTVHSTDRRIAADGCRGFENPLAGA